MKFLSCSLANLTDQAVLDQVRTLLAQVDRPLGSSGWLNDAPVGNPLAYDAMITYEALVLEANQTLTRHRQDPLHVI